MKRKLNVLVFPCGSENASEIYDSLKYSLHVKTYGASSIDDFCSIHYQNYIGELPNIKDTNFDDVFYQILHKNNIDIIFATHDTVLQYLSKRYDKFKVYLVNGDRNTTTVTRKKSLTYNLFKKYPWCPKVYSEISSVSEWPVVIKPDMGQGAQGVIIVNNKEEAHYISKNTIEPVIVEYLPGEEITVDCFTDRNRNIKLISPRTRERVRAGIAMKSTCFESNNQINAIATKINNKLLFRGPWFFQLKKDFNGNWKLLEICSRMAGTMVAQRAVGINLALLTIHDYLEREIILLPQKSIKTIERRITTRAILDINFEKVYIDLDDTLIFNNQADPTAMAFIYQMKNKGKDIILITRHADNVEQTLKKVYIEKNIFHEIIHIEDKSPKSNYITSSKSIFIDNHFPERLEVHETLNIPVFDVDFLSFLIR